MDNFVTHIRRLTSRGYQRDPPAVIHPSIILGPGEMLTLEFARDNQISHVINCAEDQMCPSWFKYQYPSNYRFLNAIDSVDVNILDWYPAFKETMQKFLQERNCTRVFVHCQCGINRSAFLLLMYVCDVFKYPVKYAEESILRQRPCALTNPVFRKQVYAALSKK